MHAASRITEAHCPCWLCVRELRLLWGSTKHQCTWHMILILIAESCMMLSGAAAVCQPRCCLLLPTHLPAGLLPTHLPAGRPISVLSANIWWAAEN